MILHTDGLSFVIDKASKSCAMLKVRPAGSEYLSSNWANNFHKLPPFNGLLLMLQWNQGLYITPPGSGWLVWQGWVLPAFLQITPALCQATFFNISQSCTPWAILKGASVEIPIWPGYWGGWDTCGYSSQTSFQQIWVRNPTKSLESGYERYFRDHQRAQILTDTYP